MGSGYTRDTVKTCDFSAILGGRVIREIGLYASMYGIVVEDVVECTPFTNRDIECVHSIK